MSHDLAAALLDVRKAYRLLADYQQRQFELLAYIREQLGAVQYYHEYLDALPRSIDGLENRDSSGMRYLPFFDMATLWLRSEGQKGEWDRHRKNDQLFGVWVRSDTGFDYASGQFTIPDPASSESVLVLSVVVCDAPQRKACNWYHDVWCAMPYPPCGEVRANEEVPGYRIFSDTIDLAKLSSQQEVDAAIERWRLAASEALKVQIGSPAAGKT